MRHINRNGETYYRSHPIDEELEERDSKKVSWLRVLMTLLVILGLLSGVLYKVLQ